MSTDSIIPHIIITSRLQWGVKVGNATISLGIDGEETSGRIRYRYWIDLPNFTHESNDLRSGCQGGSCAKAIVTLLSFLGAFAEARSESSDNWDLFPDELREWAKGNVDEITMIAMEIEEALA